MHHSLSLSLSLSLAHTHGHKDFDDWDDVGLNIPKPPNLLYLFRNYSTCALSDKEKIDRMQQLVSPVRIYNMVQSLEVALTPIQLAGVVN